MYLHGFFRHNRSRREWRCGDVDQCFKTRVRLHMSIFPIQSNLSSLRVVPRSSLRRIVFTSSCVAILDTSEVPVTISEADWNDPPVIECKQKGSGASPLAMYSASKTLAEKGVSGPAFGVVCD